MNKLYITIICFTIAIIGIFFVFFKYQAVDFNRTEIAKREQRIVIARQSAAHFQKIRRRLEQDYKEELNKINSAIPSDVNMPSLLNFLQRTAAHKGLHLTAIDSFSTIEVEGRPTIKETFMTFSVSGSYLGFKEFLRHIAKSDRLIGVKNINFSYGGEPHFDFSLTIKVHSY